MTITFISTEDSNGAVDDDDELVQRDSSGAVDDDELVQGANEKIALWKAAGTPSLTEVQELFHESICAGASAMARDRIVAAITAAFGTELGGKRALVGTWSKIAKDLAAEDAQAARENTKTVPRRLLPTRQGRPGGAGAPQTIGERLRMLARLHGSWKRAASIVLSEACEGCYNETLSAVVTSAAGRGVPDDVIWDLFEKHFCGDG